MTAVESKVAAQRIATRVRESQESTGVGPRTADSIHTDIEESRAGWHVCR